MSITLTLEVTIEGFKDEVSAKGNFTARGVSFVLKSAKGCEAEQMAIFTPSNGNAGTVLFLTKDKGLVAKLNKSRAAKPSEIAKLEARIAELEAEKAAKVAKKPVSAEAALRAKLAALEAEAK